MISTMEKLQMPVKTWLSALPAGYNELALEALDPENESILVSSTGEAIEAMRAWRDTKQGVDFWHAMSEWGYLVGELPPLPEPLSIEHEHGAEPTKPRLHWVGQTGTLPDGKEVKITRIDDDGSLLVNRHWIYQDKGEWPNITPYQSITWNWDKLEPSVYERFPIGRKFMLEVEVEAHDPYDQAYPLRVKTPSMYTGVFIPADDLPKD